MPIPCNFNDQQLQKKFKHASDFGIIGNYNQPNAENFKQILIKHMLDADTKVIHGTYRGESVRHFFNPLTKLNIICKNHQFISGWLLGLEQEECLLTTGNLI